MTCGNRFAILLLILIEACIAAIPAFVSSILWTDFFMVTFGLPAIPFKIFWIIWFMLMVFTGNSGSSKD